MYECHNCGWGGPVPDFDDFALPICPDCERAVYLYLQPTVNPAEVSHV